MEEIEITSKMNDKDFLMYLIEKYATATAQYEVAKVNNRAHLKMYEDLKDDAFYEIRQLIQWGDDNDINYCA